MVQPRRLSNLTRGGGAAIVALTLLFACPVVHGQSQCPDWIPTFGAQPGVSHRVQALAVFDDGTGPALYAGGLINSAGATRANDIAKWDGDAWSPLGTGITVGNVMALAVFDDGTGPALYAGGRFTGAGGVLVNGIAKWDGTSWSALGGGVAGGDSSDPAVLALEVFDDGAGPALYVGGNFSSAGGVEANHIAKWDGTSWAALGSGVAGNDFPGPEVRALEVFDHGAGPALYVAGEFTSAGGVASNNIAKWDGAEWFNLPSPFSSSRINVLTAFDDGTGAALYAGGGFSTGISKWDGTSWSALGSSHATDGPVYALAGFDDGSGPALYVGGDFEQLDGVPASGIAKWDGVAFSALGSGVGYVSFPFVTVWALAVFDEGTGPALFTGGLFESAGDVGASNIARWDGAAWSALGSGVAGVVAGPNGVAKLAVFDDGTGPALYVGGGITSAGGVVASGIARWDGTSFSSLEGGVSAINFRPPGVSALEVFDDGTGPSLFAGGSFEFAGGVAANFIAEWDGAAWSALGSGLDGNVNDLTVFDDGTGPALYAGGRFTSAGGSPATNIAKWDGMSWSALGSGITGDDPIDTSVFVLAVFDDGTGAALYAGGIFMSAGGVAATIIAQWDGASWSSLGSAFEPSHQIGNTIFTHFISELLVYDDGTGPALFAGGVFDTAGGIQTNNIAKWDGASWSALGSGVTGGTFPSVRALTIFDDGSGPALFTGGSFTSAGGVVANSIAKWNGAGWSALGNGGPSVSTLAVYDDGSGANLFVGGSSVFSPAGDSFLARWGPSNGPVCPGDANADRVIDFGDVTSVLGEWMSDGSAGGDANCDNSVNFNDITTILGNWQAPCPE